MHSSAFDTSLYPSLSKRQKDKKAHDSFEDSNDDFSDFIIKNITVFDYEVVELEDLEKAGIEE